MANYASDKPLIVQSDRTILLEVKSPDYQAARDGLSQFADLVKSPEYVHTYRITPLSLWNAAAAGITTDDILGLLQCFSRYPLPENVVTDIREYSARYGRVILQRDDGSLVLRSDDSQLLLELSRHHLLSSHVLQAIDAHHLRVDPAKRGHLKQALVSIGYPALDLAGYSSGAPLAMSLRQATSAGRPFCLRPYQQQAVAAFHADGAARGGSGVIVLPCGAGKTIVGMAVMERLQCATLILTTHTVAARQWIGELLDKSSLASDQVGEYSGLRKSIRPVTVATYQIITYRQRSQSEEPQGRAEYPHYSLFDEIDWGLIIYDEVHLLPAPVFRITAELQATRRLGLTATLVREDGREVDVFSLIGPKRYHAPWRDLEAEGWIATAQCHEIRVTLPDELRLTYALASEREKYRIAAENPSKVALLDVLLSKHPQDQILILGMYIDQLRGIAERYGYPLITGTTPVSEREELYAAFRRGAVRHLVVSKVGNFAVDLPDASVAVQVSGTFGSRQEEAQRLGRILRPKSDGAYAHLYTLVTRETRDEEFAAKRQRYLTEQGYSYDILYASEILDWEPRCGAIAVSSH